jgi:hypothetical protein
MPFDVESIIGRSRSFVGAVTLPADSYGIES